MKIVIELTEEQERSLRYQLEFYERSLEKCEKASFISDDVMALLAGHDSECRVLAGLIAPVLKKAFEDNSNDLLHTNN